MKIKDYFYFAILAVILVLLAMNLYWTMETKHQLDVMELNFRVAFQSD